MDWLMFNRTAYVSDSDGETDIIKKKIEADRAIRDRLRVQIQLLMSDTSESEAEDFTSDWDDVDFDLD